MLRNAFYKGSLAIVMGLALVAASSTAFAGSSDPRVRLRCKERPTNAEGKEIRSIEAEWESEDNLLIVDVKYDPIPANPIAGDTLQVKVNADTVGKITLADAADGDLVGGLTCNTTGMGADACDTAVVMGASTEVAVVTNLACVLQNR